MVLSTLAVALSPHNTIYALVDESQEIRYVGQTTKPIAHRLARHIWQARESGGKCQRYVSRWIRSVDYAVSIRALEVDPPDPREAERAWIEKLLADGACLTNLTRGGEGAPPRGYLLSPEQRAKISEANRRRFSDPAAREHLRALMLGRKASPETLRKMSESRRGFRHSDESRAKMSRSRRGKPKSPETRARMAAAQQARSRAARQVDGQLSLEGGDAL